MMNLRNLAVMAFLCLGLSGCASVSEYYNSCITQSAYIADQVACIKSHVAADDYLRDNTMAQEFIKQGDVLVEKVANGQMTEREAQLKLVEKLNNMKLDELKAQAYQARIDRATRDLFPRQFNCNRAGASINCTEY